MVKLYQSYQSKVLPYYNPHDEDLQKLKCVKLLMGCTLATKEYRKPYETAAPILVRVEGWKDSFSLMARLIALKGIFQQSILVVDKQTNNRKKIFSKISNFSCFCYE